MCQRLSGGMSGGKRRTQRSRSGRRRSVTGNLAGRRRLRHQFVFRRRWRARWLSGRTGLGGVFHRGFRCHCRGGFTRSIRLPGQPALHLNRDRFIDRAGVSFLLGDAQLREHVEDHIRFDLEFARQLVNSNFHHTVCPAAQLRHRGCQINPCSLSRASAPAGDSAISIVTDCSCASSVGALSTAATVSADAASASGLDSNCP